MDLNDLRRSLYNGVNIYVFLSSETRVLVGVVNDG